MDVQLRRDVQALTTRVANLEALAALAEQLAEQHHDRLKSLEQEPT